MFSGCFCIDAKLCIIKHVKHSRQVDETHTHTQIWCKNRAFWCIHANSFVQRNSCPPSRKTACYSHVHSIPNHNIWIPRTNQRKLQRHKNNLMFIVCRRLNKKAKSVWKTFASRIVNNRFQKIPWKALKSVKKRYVLNSASTHDVPSQRWSDVCFTNFMKN